MNAHATPESLVASSIKGRKIGGLKNYQKGGNLKKVSVNFERGGSPYFFTFSLILSLFNWIVVYIHLYFYRIIAYSNFYIKICISKVRDTTGFDTTTETG